MPKLYPEPLLFCLAWAALAIAAGIMASIWMGILFSAGLALILMPLSATIITKTESFRLERQARWGLLVIAALALAIWLTVSGAPLR
jgi:predicted PurR-regulated permease PerM